MKILKIFLLIAILSQSHLFGQNITISGRIINEQLEAIPNVQIMTLDTVLLGEADIDGNFQMQIPTKTDKLLLAFIGMEWTTVELSSDCKYLEVIMMNQVIYDFITLKKVDRLRKKRFENLPELRKQAYEQGLFKSDTICYNQIFEYYNQ